MEPAVRGAPMSRSGRLESCYTGAVHDVWWATGLERFTLPPEIRPLNPENCPSYDDPNSNRKTSVSRH